MWNTTFLSGTGPRERRVSTLVVKYFCSHAKYFSGQKLTETKCSSETVVAAEFHPLEGHTIVTVGKGFVNFWQVIIRSKKILMRKIPSVMSIFSLIQQV